MFFSLSFCDFGSSSFFLLWMMMRKHCPQAKTKTPKSKPDPLRSLHEARAWWAYAYRTFRVEIFAMKHGTTSLLHGDTFISSIYICLPCMILNLLNVDAVLEVNGNDRYGKNKEKSKGVIGITKPSKHTWTPEVLKVLLHWGTRSLTWFSLLAKLLAAWSLSFFYITGAWETMNSGFQDTFFLLHLLWRPGY